MSRIKKRTSMIKFRVALLMNLTIAAFLTKTLKMIINTILHRASRNRLKVGLSALTTEH